MAFIDAMRVEGYRVEQVCRVLGEYGVKIAARTYRWFKHRQPSARQVSDERVTALMRVLRETPDGWGRLPRERFYGRRKMRALLARHGVAASVSRIGLLMRLSGMEGLVRGRRVVTTKKTKPGAGDLLKRQFGTGAPNRVWVADLTYVRTMSGWVYAALVTDLYARKIVAGHTAGQMTQKLVSDTLALALAARRLEGHPVPDGLVHHADHGTQYTAIRYTEQLANAGIVASFGSVGDSYDNAVAETVNGLYKAECVAQDGPFPNLAAVEDALLDWICWYNTARLHEYLGYRTPDEAEADYYASQEPLEPQQPTHKTSSNKP